MSIRLVQPALQLVRYFIRVLRQLTIGLASHFLGMCLSIEGEDGYDPRTVARMSEVYRDFLSYGLDERGYARESVGYATGGLAGMMPGLVANVDRRNP